MAGARAHALAGAGALVALPLVLPPSVLGFYLLVAMGPNNGPALGAATRAGLGHAGVHVHQGLLIGSIVYSLPFVVQPLINAFEAIGERPLEAAAPRCAPARSTPSGTWRCRWPGRAT